MKMRGTWVNVLKFAGVSVLVSSLWFLATSRSPEKRVHQAGAGQSPITASEGSRLPRQKTDHRLIEAYGKLPLSFEENVGQTAQEVRYVPTALVRTFLNTSGSGARLARSCSHDLSPLHRFKTMRALREASRARTMTAVRMRIEGANPAAQISGMDQLLKRTNYFIGSDPEKWHTDVPSYARVKYAGIYPGVDLVFYGNQRRLEYDFVVAPGTDPKVNRTESERRAENADNRVAI